MLIINKQQIIAHVLDMVSSMKLGNDLNFFGAQ